MITNVFIELSIIILITFVVAAVFKLLKQPLIIAYIIVGILVSPYVFNLVKFSSAISTFAQIGVVLLLFMVGLSLSVCQAMPQATFICQRRRFFRYRGSKSSLSVNAGPT